MFDNSEGVAMSIQNIQIAQSQATEAKKAVDEFYKGVMQPNTELVLFFCSSKYDLDIIASEMDRLFAGIMVVGCTTAGEIGPEGYLTHSLTGVSFPSASFKAVSGVLHDLEKFQMTDGHSFVQTLLQELERKSPEVSAKNSFALMLIDGLSIREEPVAHALQYSLGNISLFGGSAGDDLKFAKTYVYRDGHFYSDSALLVLITTSLPFTIFKTQHFVSTDERLVVTEADISKRIVKEINGLPAAQEYARLLGVTINELDPAHFSASPVVVMIDGTDYVRSIQKANPDGSLTFFCAIDEGLVLRVAKGVGLIDNLEQTFNKIQEKIGEPQLVLGCDCILRSLEIKKNGLEDQVSEVFKSNNMIGFNSYGEQYKGVHVNQTLTGIAIGTSSKSTIGGHDE